METFFTPQVMWSVQVFKSYYVVWKPIWKNEARKGNGKFKSYYVVWKLFRKRLIRMFDILFKSYYVVWKLIFGCIGCLRRCCLNRTM